MKKKLVAEMLYLAAVLVLIMVFERNRREEELPVASGALEVVLQETTNEEARQEDKDEEGKMSLPIGGNGDKDITPSVLPTLSPAPHPTEAAEQMTGEITWDVSIRNEDYEQYDNTKYEWWFVRKDDHSPSGSGEAFPIDAYDAYYLDKTVSSEDKVVYLTFDCGYENGYTPAILDVLAKQNVKALFFVTKDFIVKNPEYVTRMKEEGHMVGNHTVRHLSSPSLTPEELKAELDEVARTMYEVTGYRLDPFFRPPMGEYSERTLKVTQDLGYCSIFWSIAYYDYDVNDQPGKEYVVDHFNTYHHNGTIILMHNTSKSNAEALEEVVELLKGEGYRFGEVGE